jgi:hypothetical protein
MATGSITDFLTSFKTELARPNHFDVLINLPIKVQATYENLKDVERELRLRCEATELPGRSLLTAPMKVYGVEEKYPYLSNFNDITFTFIVTDTMKEKRFFESWINFIHPSSTFNFKYKDDYSTSVYITQYNLKKEESYKVELLKAYPVGVNQMDLNWSSDGFHKLTVSFVYDKWREVGTDVFEQAEINQQNSLVSSLVRNDIVYQGININPGIRPGET